MKVRVTYTTGKVQLFIVPMTMRVVDFCRAAIALGGGIRKVDFK